MINNEKIEGIALKFIKWMGSIESVILHTVLFILAFILYFAGIKFDVILLTLTTIVSLEAIYFSIFIQMSLNIQAKKINSMAQLQEDIQEDVEEIQENVEEIQENVEDIQKDIEEIQEENEEEEKDDEEILTRLEATMNELVKEFQDLKNKKR
jgi:uncharacterized membrane protein